MWLVGGGVWLGIDCWRVKWGGVGHPLGLSLGPRTHNFRPPKPFQVDE